MVSLTAIKGYRAQSSQIVYNHFFFGFGTWKLGLLPGSVRVQSLKFFKFVTPVKLILMYAFA
jgi:hypothetical protein